jgi:hypothetical protein
VVAFYKPFEKVFLPLHYQTRRKQSFANQTSTTMVQPIRKARTFISPSGSVFSTTDSNESFIIKIMKQRGWVEQKQPTKKRYVRGVKPMFN